MFKNTFYGQTPLSSAAQWGSAEVVSVLLAKGAEGRDGEVHVVKVGPKYELLSTNPVGEVLMATRAISDGMIFMRSMKHVIGIGEAPSL